MALKSEDLLSTAVRKNLLEEIKGPENKERKNEAFSKYEIYNNRIEPILMKAMSKEFDKDTIQEMRPITSLALCERVVNELASVYRQSPERSFQRLSEKKLSEMELKQLDAHYRASKVDVKLKRANRFFELYGQCALYMVPKMGRLMLRPLSPFQYDIIPHPDAPEMAMGYVLSVHDREQVISTGSAGLAYDLANPPSYNARWQTQKSDSRNQKIADPDDYKKLANQRFVWWTNELNFVSDGLGNIIDPATDQPAGQITDDLIVNPIQRLPFIDLAMDKDAEFWVRPGSGTPEFSIEFMQLLMDVFFIHKMQGYSQGIIYSEKPPASMKIGPNRVMHIPLDPNKEIQPRFEFTSPSPDMNASLELVENFLRLFMSSKGIEPKTVSGRAETNRYNSGLERLLAMIERFEASSDTIDLFGWAEKELVELIVSWNNVMYPVTDASSTTEPLDPMLRLAMLPDDTTVEVNFKTPEGLQTKAEKRQDVLEQLDNGLMSRSEAIMELRGLNQQDAVRAIQKIDQEAVMLNQIEPQDDMEQEGDLSDSESDEIEEASEE